MPEFLGKKVTDERLLGKGTPSKWRSLALYRTHVTDDGIIQLCAIAKKLEEVHIESKLISDVAMPALCALPNLRSLLLDGVPRVTDQGIAHIANVSDLRELYLNGTRLTDTGIDPVLNCRQVWSLALAGTELTDAGVSKLGALPGLRIVRLDGVQIDGSGLSGLSNYDRLDLYVAGCPITDAALIAFLSRVGCVKR